MTRPSPLQNRSAPDGGLHATVSRGLLMGNRGGRLHHADATLGTARWRSRAWIACRLEFRGRHRRVMGGGYTEIFFLDEATALAAGHRPCFECRRADARAFAAAWAEAQGMNTPPRAPEMDRILHLERLGGPESVVRGCLPPGTIIAVSGGFRLCGPNGLLTWGFEGYTPASDVPPDQPVAAITPASIRGAIAAGYRPMLHPSAETQFSAR